MKPIYMTIFLFVSHPVIAASFDCTKVRTSVERAICENPQLSNMDSELSRYYQSLLASFKKYPHDPGYRVFVSFQKSWLSYRNLCKTSVCIFDLYALQLSNLYDHHVSMDGKYTFFSAYDPGNWFQYVLKSYGVKRGISFKHAVQLLENVDWHIQSTQNKQALTQGITCGYGWQAVCYVTFKHKHLQFDLIVIKPNDTWLVDTHRGGIFER